MSMDKSLLSAVIEEMKKSEKESAKNKLKAMFADRVKTVKILADIDDNIVALLTSVGETEEGIRILLAD